MALPVYLPVSLPIARPLSELAAGDLEIYKNWFLANIDTRLAMLVARVAASPDSDGPPLDYSEQSLAFLDSWLRSNLKVRARTEAELHSIHSNLRFMVPVDKWTLDDLSVSFCFDTAIYLGEALRRACKARWVQDLSSRRSVDFGHVLVKGAGKVSLNPLRVVLNLGIAATREPTPQHTLDKLFRTWCPLLE